MDLRSYVFDEIVFWSGFLFFNFSLFAFNYFINYKEAKFFPFKQLLIKGGRGVFLSPNPDFFRFSIDMSALILLVRYGFLSSFVTLITIYYGFLIIFNTYHYSFNKIYQVNPILLNDLKLLKNGAGILWNESRIKLITGLSTLIIATLFLSACFARYLEYTKTLSNNLISTIFTVAIIIIFITALARKGYGRFAEVWHRYLIHFLRIGRHIFESYKLFIISKKFNHEILKKNRKLNLKFHSKPNLYLLFIESYGSILLKHPNLSAAFIKKFEAITKELSESKWNYKSNLSTSVSLIGPSWLAYTSVLLGRRVDTNFYYEHLLKDDRYHEFDTLTKVFQNHGYYSYNLNATKFMNGVNVPTQLMQRFYGFDKFVLTHDIPFSGTKYGFSESPPDQYVLNHMYENHLKDQSMPFVLFYLTKNSHSPFSTPPIPDNWKNLNNTPDKTIDNNFLEIPNFENYSKSIAYQLEFVKDFIIRNGSDQDIFLLVGDHQPHVLSTNSDGTETIVHLISKNEDFLSEFEAYGFTDSIENLTNPVKHEALFSIFLRSFIKTYGEKNQKLPEYEPDGLQF